MSTAKGQAGADQRTDHVGLKRVARRLVLELAVVIALVSYQVNFPRDTSYTQSWIFVLTHPLVLLHVLVGTVILVESFVFLVRAIPGRSLLWVALAIGGLAFVLLAYATGEVYVATRQATALTYMSLGWFGAIVAYGFGWYWGRDRATRRNDETLQAPSTTGAAHGDQSGRGV